jgi:hypothetical protein
MLQERNYQDIRLFVIIDFYRAFSFLFLDSTAARRNKQSDNQAA